MSAKKRIVDLQKSLRIARQALERIRHGHCGHTGPERVAEDALDDMFVLERKQPLQGVVGHGRPTP